MLIEESYGEEGSTFCSHIGKAYEAKTKPHQFSHQQYFSSPSLFIFMLRLLVCDTKCLLQAHFYAYVLRVLAVLEVMMMLKLASFNILRLPHNFFLSSDEKSFFTNLFINVKRLNLGISQHSQFDFARKPSACLHVDYRRSFLFRTCSNFNYNERCTVEGKITTLSSSLSANILKNYLVDFSSKHDKNTGKFFYPNLFWYWTLNLWRSLAIPRKFPRNIFSQQHIFFSMFFSLF